MPVALLMTAAIVPPNPLPGKSPAVLDPGRRLAEYLRALTFYIHEPGFDDIVFCENTGADLSAVEGLARRAAERGKRLEVIGFRGDRDLIARFGYYGCGEAEIIDHAVLHSNLLRQHPSFCKVTGRYLLRNPARVLHAIGSRRDFFCHDGFTPVTHFASVMFEVMTAFFMVSRTTYDRCLYRKVIPVYEWFYSHPNVEALFPARHPYLLLEQVYYVLLRNVLKSARHGYVPVAFEHWQYGPLASRLRDLALSASGLDRFGPLHWIVDRLFFDRMYGDFLGRKRPAVDQV